MVRLGTTKEKRLMINIIVIRESYKRQEISKIRWITGDSNPADIIIKATPNSCLQTFVSTNELLVRVKG
jgi:hypothetical protein